MTGTTHGGLHVGYVMSRFPKVSETFILYEMEAVERAGARVFLFPLLRERTAVVHPEAVGWTERAHYLPFVSPAIVAGNLRWFLRHPVRYLRTLGEVLAGTWGSLNFFAGAVGIFPKTVHAAELMAAAGVDHVHCHFASHPAVAGLIVHRLTGIPFSFTAHGSDLHVDRHMLPQKVGAATVVVTVSEDNRRLILEECRSAGAHGAVEDEVVDKVVVIPCGVDTDELRPGDPPPAPPLRVLAVGTLHEVKGQRVLIDACARLVAGGTEVEVEIVGDGPDRADLERQATARGLDDRVRFRGALARPDVLDAYRRAHVLAAPSVPTRRGKREGIPVVLMEAMAHGLPVVASRLSGIPELVEPEVNGLLVAPGDAAEVATALGRLAADPALRARLGAAGRATVERRFDLDANAARLLETIAGSGP